MLNFKYGQGDLYFLCLMDGTSSEISMQSQELSECQWQDLKFLKNNTYYPIDNHVMHSTILKHINDDGQWIDNNDVILNQLRCKSWFSQKAVNYGRPQNYFIKYSGKESSEELHINN